MYSLEEYKKVNEHETNDPEAMRFAASNTEAMRFVADSVTSLWYQGLHVSLVHDVSSLGLVLYSGFMNCFVFY
jgi:hypothetical protein